MLTEERLALICEFVERNGSATIQDIMEYTGASESTVRRDLSELNKQLKVQRVRGGAISRKLGTRDIKVQSRRTLNSDDKEIIAGYAAGLIKNDDFVYIDSGTTTERVIEHIEAKDAVFVTNSLTVIRLLASRNLRCYILGGEFKESTDAIVGEYALDSISKYNFTKGFFGTNGITKKNGFTTPEAKEAMVKQAAMKNTRDAFILADAAKFGAISSVKFADFQSARIITTKLRNKDYLSCRNITIV